MNSSSKAYYDLNKNAVFIKVLLCLLFTQPVLNQILKPANSQLNCTRQDCINMPLNDCKICYYVCQQISQDNSSNIIDTSKQQSNLSNANNSKSEKIVFKSCSYNPGDKFGFAFEKTNVSQFQCRSQCCKGFYGQFSITLLNKCKSKSQTYHKLDSIWVAVGYLFLFVMAGLLLCAFVSVSIKYLLKIKGKIDKKIETYYLGNWIRISDKQLNEISMNNKCSICLSDKVDCITKCKHYFHYDCISHWLKQESNCPICKGRKINPVTVICQTCHKRSKWFNIQGTNPAGNIIKICNKCEKTMQQQTQMKQNYLQPQTQLSINKIYQPNTI